MNILICSLCVIIYVIVGMIISAIGVVFDKNKYGESLEDCDIFAIIIMWPLYSVFTLVRVFVYLLKIIKNYLIKLTRYLSQFLKSYKIVRKK